VLPRRRRAAPDVIEQRRETCAADARAATRAAAGRPQPERRGSAPAVAAHQQLALGRSVGVPEVDRHQEAIELGFRQRVCADLLDRVLGGDDEEGVGQAARLAFLRHLALLHRLEQRALGLGRRAVYLVGEHHRIEDRPGMEPERLRVSVEDRHPENVRGEQVARELDPRVLEPEGGGERLREGGLPHARDVLDQQVPAGEQAGEGEPQRVPLADDDALELREHRRQLAAAAPYRINGRTPDSPAGAPTGGAGAGAPATVIHSNASLLVSPPRLYTDNGRPAAIWRIRRFGASPGRLR
jgi:hypothetical protein